MLELGAFFVLPRLRQPYITEALFYGLDVKVPCSAVMEGCGPFRLWSLGGWGGSLGWALMSVAQSHSPSALCF